MMSRTARRLVAGLLVTAAPVAAQDTSYTIRSDNGRSECTVKVNGKRLDRDEERKVCERMQERSSRMTLELRDRLALTERQLDGVRREHERVARDTVMTAAMARSLDAARAGQLETIRRNMERGTAELESSRRNLSERVLASVRARAIIGVNVAIDANANDRYGATISAVTPGRPADKAGIRAGDIITKVDGTSMAGGDRRSTDDDRSLPGLRLTETVAKLVPGKAVKFELRRGNDNRTVTVTPIEDPESDVFTFTAPGMGGWTMTPSTGAGGRIAPATPSIEGRGVVVPFPEGGATRRSTITTEMPSSYAFRILTNGALSSLELAPVNEKLGAYFGTSEGVLVINAGEAQNLGLQPGDVITAVDGRKVTTPSQFYRVLGTYESGEEFKLQVTRQKRSETITTRLTPPSGGRMTPQGRTRSSSGSGGNR